MSEFIRLCAGLLSAMIKSRAALQAENLALWHQLCVYKKSVKRPKVRPVDRILWSLLAKTWAGWKDALIFVILMCILFSRAEKRRTRPSTEKMVQIKDVVNQGG
jgi:hypothetical protein